MNLESLLHAYEHGSLKPGVFVFRYHVLWLLPSLLKPIFFTLIFLFMILGLNAEYLASIEWINFKEIITDRFLLLLVASSILIALVGFLFTLYKSFALKYASNNILIVAPDGIVKRERGKIYTVHFSQISDYKDISRTGYSLIPEREISFFDQSQNKHVRLIKNRCFGNVNHIHQAIKRNLSDF